MRVTPGGSVPAGRGFTLIEMVIVIGIVAILAALITPLAVNQIAQKRFDACREELVLVRQAIVGDPTLIQGGIRSSFGFVGDLGTLPATLTDLTTQGAWSPWPQDSGYGWFWGWRGPYLSEVDDPWGQPYRYATAGLPTGIAARIWSIGPDGVTGSADDVTSDIRRDEVWSMVAGNTFDKDYVQATFSGSVNGTEPIALDYPDGSGVAQAALSYSAPPVYHLTSAIPIGIRSIRFKASAVLPAVTMLLPVNNGPVTTLNLVDPH